MSSVPSSTGLRQSSDDLLHSGLKELEAARVLIAAMPQGARLASIHVLRAAEALMAVRRSEPDAKDDATGLLTELPAIPENKRAEWRRWLPIVAGIAQPHSSSEEVPPRDVDRAVSGACDILEEAFVSARQGGRPNRGRPLPYAKAVPSAVAIVIVGVIVLAYVFRARPPEGSGSVEPVLGTTSERTQLREDDVFPFQFGDVVVDQDWTRVELDPGLGFEAPVVVAKPASRNDTDPGVIRIRNLDAAGFEIRIQEWDYLEGHHSEETVSYLVLKRGGYVLPGGARVEAGQFATRRTVSSPTIAFAEAFTSVPVVIASVTSYRGENAVTTRLSNVSENGFECRLQEQQKNESGHPEETIDYVAWEQASGTIGEVRYEVGRTDKVVRGKFHAIAFTESFAEAPAFLADLQTRVSLDPANLRWRNKALDGVDVKVDEEQSLDKETGHRSEVVGYILLAHSGSRREAGR